MATYDDHYQEDNLFGDPYPEFVQFIEDWPQRGTALDVGCGQGRDALFLADAGYEVTGIDISKVGIDQMLVEAKKRGLQIKGLVFDAYSQPLEHSYDLILFNSMFHFEKNDKEREVSLLSRSLDYVNSRGILALFIHKSTRKERVVTELMAPKIEAGEWRVVADRYIDYLYEQKSANFRTEMQFRMFFLQKV